MSGKGKCISNEGMEILLWAAKNGSFISSPRHDEFKTICSLVEAGHLFQGNPVIQDSESVSYSITKNGYLVLQCNFLWDVFDEKSARPHIIAHINSSNLDCHKACLHSGTIPTEKTSTDSTNLKKSE